MIAGRTLNHNSLKNRDFVSISTLSINQFRNMIGAEIHCSPRFNLFFGDNAAGKTSILEAIYYLGTGKSFRTHHHDRIIQHDQNQLTLFVRLDTEFPTAIGLQRLRDGSLKIRINEEDIRSVAETSRFLPIQFIGSDSHRILSDGPKCRREFLDWGLFHTNPTFFTQWKQFQKLLVQRNAALRMGAPRDELMIWNHEFALAGEALTLLRNAYVDDFSLVFNEIVATLLKNIDISIDYLPGWNQNLSLEACLNQHVSRETLIGHSLYGPQRADLTLTVNKSPAQDELSQGQQKLVSYALRLAQGVHLQTNTGKTPVYLIDDLPSELDPQKRSLVIDILSKLNAQVFITGIESIDLEEILPLHHDNRMFHVEHGVVMACMSEAVCFT